MAVIHEHQCVLPETLRQSLDVDMSSTHQYMPRNNTTSSVDMNGGQFNANTTQSSLINHKRPASEMIPDLRGQQQQTQSRNISLDGSNQNNSGVNKVSFFKLFLSFSLIFGRLVDFFSIGNFLNEKICFVFFCLYTTNDKRILGKKFFLFPVFFLPDICLMKKFASVFF